MLPTGRENMPGRGMASCTKALRQGKAPSRTYRMIPGARKEKEHTENLQEVVLCNIRLPLLTADPRSTWSL